MIHRCDTQAEYEALWRAQAFADTPPGELAEQGARLADRAAWVFIAAYQGAMRQAFPALRQVALAGASPSAGVWASYLVSEARDASKTPTCTLQAHERGWVLDGHKNWVAARPHLGWLVVNASLPEGGTANVLVDATAPGVELQEKPGGRFLPELEVGTATFAAVILPAEARLEDDATHAQLFGLIEARCLLVAMAAHFNELLPDAEAPAEALALAQGLVTPELGQAGSIRVLLAAMSLLGDWFDGWKDEEHPAESAELRTVRLRWAGDVRLVRMHQGVLEKRLAAA